MQLSTVWTDPVVVATLTWITIAILIASGGLFAITYFKRRSNKVD